MAKSKYNIGDSVRIIRKNIDSVNAFGVTGTVIELAGDRPTTRPICGLDDHTIFITRME